MKKRMILLTVLLSLLFCTSCGRKASPITLPQPEDILTVQITEGSETVTHSDADWIWEMIIQMTDARPTRRQSVQDVPKTDSWLKIEIEQLSGMSVIFAYEDGGRFYLEQPYQGIYQIDGYLYEMLREEAHDEEA